MNTYTISEYGIYHAIICASPDPLTAAGITDLCYDLDDALDRLQTRYFKVPHYIDGLAMPHLIINFAHDTPAIRRADPDYHKIHQTNIAVSDPAWEAIQDATRTLGYAGSGPTTGCTHYLLELLRVNPQPHLDWADTRPEHLKMWDQFLASQGQFPYWYDRDDLGPHQRRKTRMINAAHYNEMLPTLRALADHFLITPYRRGDKLNPEHRARCVIDAIGRGWLTPKRRPRVNPEPVKPTSEKYARYARNKNASERFSF